MSTKSVGLIGHDKFLSWPQLDGCSVTRPFRDPDPSSLRRVWLARLPSVVSGYIITEGNDQAIKSSGREHQAIKNFAMELPSAPTGDNIN